MNILQIDIAANVGSTGRIAEGIGQEIIKRGWGSYIAYGRHFKAGSSNTIKIGNKFDQLIHVLQTRLFDRHGEGSSLATRKLIKDIKRINPDIVHLHQLHGYYINIRLLFKFLKAYSRPIVWTFHDAWPMTGHCCYFNRFDCEKWKTGCFDCPLTKYYPQSWWFDNSRRNYDLKKNLFNIIEKLTIVSVSSWLDQIVKESYFKRKASIVINNGVDINIFQKKQSDNLRNKLHLDKKNVLLGIASIWSDHKGLSDIIQIARMIDQNTCIIVIGVSKRQKRELPDNIIGLERIANPDQLAEFYSLADVFINPSKMESFGLVTAEALACGTPAVVYNVTACPELIKPGTGYIVDPGNVQAMYNATMKILNDGKEKYTDKCRTTAEEFFNMSVQFKEYVKLYESLRKG